MIILNGKKTDGLEGLSVAEMITQNGYKKAFIAVEYNGEILLKAEYESTIIKENDIIEVVSFVGGG